MIGSKSKPFQSHPVFLLLLLLFLLILHRHCTDAQSPTQPIKPITRPRSGWDPSIGIFIVVLVGTFFLVAVFSAFLRRCAESCCLVQQQGNNNTEWPCSCSEGGIHPETLETFPTLLYSTVKDIRIRKEGVPDVPLECAVCIAEFTDDDTLRLLPNCNHVFHPPCIDAWLSSHVTCPVCRANLDRDPGEVAVTVTAQPSDGGENVAEGSENRAEQSGAGGSEIEGHPAAREASARRRSGEEGRGARDCASRSTLLGKRMVIARSNTTGHSVVEAGECAERYTLRLPEDVKKYIILNRRVVAMQRSASYNVMGSGKKGLCWSDSDGSSRGKRGQGSVRGKGRM